MAAQQKTFYLETFGCQMNAHDSEKVVGTLVSQGYSQGKKFGVLGCVAQQEGHKIFERAPHVSMVCGSASYRNLPHMLVQIEAGNRHVTGLDDRQTDECFETE